MAFEQYRIEDMSKETKSLIKKTLTLAAFTQNILFAMAERLESEQSAEHLSKFVVELSEFQGSGNTRKLVLSSTARQVGTYMKNFLPLEWKDDSFHLDSAKAEGFNWEEARTQMEKMRWDKYKAIKADEAFNAENIFKRAMASLNEILKHKDDLPDDQKQYAVKAERMLNSYGELKA